MPAFPTALTATTRFIAPGVSKCYFVPTISGYPAAATRAELTAGTDLTAEIADVSGFSAKTDFVETPDLGDAYVSKVVGRIKTDDSSITFHASKNTTDVRGTLTQGLSGFIVWLDGGDVPAQKMDQFAVTVGSVTAQRNAAGSDNLRVMVEFAQTKKPGFQVAIPANP